MTDNRRWSFICFPALFHWHRSSIVFCVRWPRHCHCHPIQFHSISFNFIQFHSISFNFTSSDSVRRFHHINQNRLQRCIRCKLLWIHQSFNMRSHGPTFISRKYFIATGIISFQRPQLFKCKMLAVQLPSNRKESWKILKNSKESWKQILKNPSKIGWNPSKNPSIFLKILWKILKIWAKFLRILKNPSRILEIHKNSEESFKNPQKSFKNRLKSFKKSLNILENPEKSWKIELNS